MATPRKQYASDHRRWFRVTEDILDDPGYRNLAPINQAVWIDLLAIFNRQQAHRQGNTVVLPWRSARQLLRSQTLEGVVARVRALSNRVGLHAARVPEGLLLSIPNYAKTQGRTPTRLRCNSDATPHTTTTTTTTPIELPSASPSGTPEGKDNSKVKPRKRAPPPSTEALLVADHLIEQLRARHPGARVRRTAWAREIEGIEASEEEKLATIDWLFSVKNSGDFVFVVACGKTLADKWARIRERMGKGNRPRSPARPPAAELPEPEPAATLEQVWKLRRDELDVLEVKVAKGDAKGYDVDRLHQLRKLVEEGVQK